MKKTFCELILDFLFLFSIISCASTAFGQNPKKCDVKDLPKPKYNIASLYKTEILGIKVTMKSKYQTDENLILLARYLKQRYCDARSMIVLIFDNKKDAQTFTVYQVKQIPDTLRASYYLDLDKGKEELVRVKVIDNKQVETPVKLPD